MASTVRPAPIGRVVITSFGATMLRFQTVQIEISTAQVRSRSRPKITSRPGCSTSQGSCDESLITKKTWQGKGFINDP